ncbi:hypothetical protein LJC10_05035 [Selenomonadales bacterium OttesenSCG-928-I06]|nr:hypothetical protein [Selenomonadales bacterium OttesenSCG-928-I06]
MSEYVEFVKDFAKRTKENLDFIEKNHKNNNHQVYEFTQLVNSLLGLIVIPKEKEYRKINDSFVKTTTLENLKNKIERDDYNNNSFKQILRRMRNAIAHAGIEIKPNENNNIINKIKFTDINTTNTEDKGKIFIIELTHDDLRDFVEDFSCKLQEKL